MVANCDELIEFAGVSQKIQVSSEAGLFVVKYNPKH
jgi:hypothetical protein